MGAVAVGATIYFGSEQSRRQLVEIAEAFEYAHELGMATILWCYLRNNAFKKGRRRLSCSSRFDRTSQSFGSYYQSGYCKTKSYRSITVVLQPLNLERQMIKFIPI